MPDGELALGGWGEGLVDRRHPHTYLNEAKVWGSGPIGRVASAGIAGGLAAGKGIVPFGTDDPMSRPFVRFPVNHHLAQIVERAEIATGWRIGSVGLEGAVFNELGIQPSVDVTFGQVSDAGGGSSRRWPSTARMMSAESRWECGSTSAEAWDGWGGTGPWQLQMNA